MKRKDIAAGLYVFSGSLKPINTHSHHAQDETHQGLDLRRILESSYVNWCGVAFSDTPEGMREYFAQVRHNSYFVWLEKAMMELYGLGERLDETTFSRFDEAVRRAHEDTDHHLKILTGRCGYERVILDAYWKPGSDNDHPEIFAPAFRVNTFFFGYSKAAQDHNNSNPFAVYGWNTGMDFCEYFARIDQTVAEMKRAGCIALKSALAYDRGLDFRMTDRKAAERGYMNPAASAEDIKAFQDYLFFEFCRLSVKYGLPFQNHTGLGCLRNTNAMQLREAIGSNPETKFCLFHGSYPWTEDIAGLVYNYPNVYADLCWLPIISTSACGRLVRELIEVGTLGTMMWGCDTWTGEESFGALLAVRKVLSDVFAGLVADGNMTLRDAERYIERILCGNPKTLFALQTHA